MTPPRTPLDDLARTPFHEAGAVERAALLRALADTWLVAALEGADPDAQPPRLRRLDLPDVGRAVLACDDERRLAAALGAGAHAGMPGRTLVALLAGQGLALLVNPGAPSQMLLPAGAVAWLAARLNDAASAEPVSARGGSLAPPSPAMVAALLPAVGERLAALGPRVRGAALAAAPDGRHLLVLDGVAAADEGWIARAVAELAAFLPPLPAPLDVTFAALPLPAGAVRVALAPAAASPADPAPPRLRR